MTLTTLVNVIITNNVKRMRLNITKKVGGELMDNPKQIEIQFHKDMLGIYERAKKIGYNASRFKQMVANQGGYAVAKKFIQSNTPSEGFISLWELGSMDLTVEALILKDVYSTLFSLEERRIVADRLKEYGYEVPLLQNPNDDEAVNTWIFQGNPNVFDIDNYVQDNKFIWWSIRQEHFADEFNINDTVFLWRSDGGKKGTGGVLAKCRVVSLPVDRTDDSNSQDYWNNDDWSNSYLAIKLEVQEVNLREGFISRISLLEHSVLKDLLIHRLRQQTNYLLSHEHATELDKMWTLSNNKSQVEIDIEAELAEEDDFYTDGAVKYFYGKRYERNPINREKAIEIHGLNCVCCGFNFEKVYGERGKDFIEVHHVKPLSTIKEDVIINPETDLVPICSNCHRMIHREKDNVLTVEELRLFLAEHKTVKS
jgi:5-methylcytosine-specific restriction enzyme A